MTESKKNSIDIDNFPIGNKNDLYVPPLEFNARKMIDYLKATDKSFDDLTKEEIEKLK